MPKPAWYLATGTTAPDTPLVNTLTADRAHESSDHAYLDPSHIAAALHIAVEMTNHVGRAIASGYGPAHPHDLDRLIVGLNHLAAQLAQTLQRLSYHADQRDLPGLAETPTGHVASVTGALAHAGLYSELTAGHLKETQLALARHQLATHHIT